MRLISTILFRAAQFSLTAFLLAIGYFALNSPVALQKLLTLRPMPDGLKLYEESFGKADMDEIRSRLSAIPLVLPRDTPVWDVEPSRRTSRTLGEGVGNCSNFSFGALYEFIQNNQRAHIVHFLRRDLSFLQGRGHTVVEASTERGDILVDYMYAGFPLTAGQHLGIADLSKGNSLKLDYVALNAAEPVSNLFFSHEYLELVDFGLVPQPEVIAYFDFISAIYVDLGSPYLEKLFFDTLSVMYAHYPRTYVPDSLYTRMVSERALPFWMSRIAFYAFHATSAFLLAALIASALAKGSDRRRA